LNIYQSPLTINQLAPIASPDGSTYSGWLPRLFGAELDYHATFSAAKNP
jgi:hypothetical protein